jgi:elongation factor P
VIVFENEPFRVMASEFMRKQATRPVMRTQLKNLKTGVVLEHTFKQSDKVAEADMGRTTAQYLYRDGSQVEFMRQDSFEQMSVDETELDENAKFMKEGEEVTLLLFEDKLVGVELPIKIERKVVDAPPGVKGNTATNVMKEIVIEGGVKMRAPLFVKTDDIIRVDTRDGSFVERV